MSFLSARRGSSASSARGPVRKLIDPSIQYKTRRPVSILKATKAEQIEEYLGTKEPLEQSYMWDQDQAKEGKAEENATIHSQNLA